MTGLTKEEVRLRLDAGLVNQAAQTNTRTYRQIIRDNVLTFFNLLNTALFAAVLLVGSPRNGLFMGTILFNTCIGLVQEIRAKRILDKMSVITQGKIQVLRDAELSEIPMEELVLGDLVWLKAGDQVPADAKVMEGSLEVNESLLTGESDSVYKSAGQELLSGSYVSSGKAWCTLTGVGSASYAANLTRQAKAYRRHDSELRNTMDHLLKIISVMIGPLGLLLFLKSCLAGENGFRASVITTVAAVIGMIPEGLILLISISLTGCAILLARKNTLVQELFCIETLARVDTLCLDKTGTLTTGEMKVERVIPLKEGASDAEQKEISSLIGTMMRILPDENPTAMALRRSFPSGPDRKSAGVIPFSSERKYSGVIFEETGAWYLGAEDFLFPEGSEAGTLCSKYAAEGYRTLLLAGGSKDTVLEDLREGRFSLPEDLTPAAIVLLEDQLRPNVCETLEYFRSQGVEIKILSGDAPETVAAVARKAGLTRSEYYADASRLKTYAQIKKTSRSCNVYGRVSPAQKREMILALKADGHKTAMVGDGVNDILALKEADCSIALGNGSGAAKNLSNIILMDSDFSVLPEVVAQGRSVIGNMRSASSMFLIKTIFSFLLCLVTIFWGENYPFQPIQLTLIGALSVGVPCFFLSQERNTAKVEGNFLKEVFRKAFPVAGTITICNCLIMLTSSLAYPGREMTGTACFLVTGWLYMSALHRVYEPLNPYRCAVIYTMRIAFIVLAAVCQKILLLGPLEFGMVILLFALMTAAPVMTQMLEKAADRMLDFFL